MFAEAQGFKRIVGAAHVVEADGCMTIAPASTEELSAVMRRCSELGVVVSPRGGATKTAWGNPTASQVELDTRRLCGVREHVWQDMTATVSAGTTWSAMQAALGEHKQQVALDPLFPETSTVGGVIAVNDSGALRQRYGSLRDLVLGITIVLADGTIARSGGKVVKNVAGYDLPKLLIGSFGTLGIIAEVTFRLHPVEQHTQSWTIESTDAAPLQTLLHQLLRSSLSLRAIQLRCDDRGPLCLDVQFASVEEALREHEQQLREFCLGLTIEPSDANVWRMRQEVFNDPSATILKVTALPSKLTAILAGFRLACAHNSFKIRTVAEAVGIVTVAINADANQVVALVEDLRARLIASGGAVVIVRSALVFPTDFNRWGPEPQAIAVMRAIKNEFDPARLLNPGIFVGGI